MMRVTLCCVMDVLAAGDKSRMMLHSNLHDADVSIERITGVHLHECFDDVDVADVDAVCVGRVDCTGVMLMLMWSA